MRLQTSLDTLYTVSHRDQEYSVPNFYTFKCINVIFGKQLCEDTAKVVIQQISTSPNQCCYLPYTTT